MIIFNFEYSDELLKTMMTDAGDTDHSDENVQAFAEYLRESLGVAEGEATQEWLRYREYWVD